MWIGSFKSMTGKARLYARTAATLNDHRQTALDFWNTCFVLLSSDKIELCLFRFESLPHTYGYGEVFLDPRGRYRQTT